MVLLCYSFGLIFKTNCVTLHHKVNPFISKRKNLSNKNG